MLGSALLIKAATAGVFLTFTGTAAAASAGALPAPAQNAVSSAAEHVGVHVPRHDEAPAPAEVELQMVPRGGATTTAVESTPSGTASNPATTTPSVRAPESTTSTIGGSPAGTVDDNGGLRATKPARDDDSADTHEDATHDDGTSHQRGKSVGTPTTTTAVLRSDRPSTPTTTTAPTLADGHGGSNSSGKHGGSDD